MGEAFIVKRNKQIIEDPNAAPIYTFSSSGDEFIWEDNVNWHIKLTKSGTFTFKTLGTAKYIDVFCVGAGGGSYDLSGGGGGYTITKRNIQPVKGEAYTITIGAGSIQGSGGSTSAFGVKAGGGKYGSAASGGDGGSGGGGYNWYSSLGSNSGKGGTDGGNGYCTASSSKRGLGQEKQVGPNGELGSTRAFGEASGTVYSGGGGGVITIGSNATYTSQAGGAGGGGKSGSGGSGNNSSCPVGTNGTANTGGGGGAADTKGGSGIVIIRNSRYIPNNGVYTLYNVGDENEIFTGGWVGKAMKSNSSSGVTAKAPTITRGTNSIKATFTASNGGVFYCKNVIDLTDISTVTAVGSFVRAGSSTANLRFYAWAPFGTYYHTTNKAFTQLATGDNQTVTLDVSDLTGPHYIGFGMTAKGTTVNLTSVTMQ